MLLLLSLTVTTDPTCTALKGLYQELKPDGKSCCDGTLQFGDITCEGDANALTAYKPFWMDPRTLVYKDRDFSRGALTFEPTPWATAVWNTTWSADEMRHPVRWGDVATADLRAMSARVAAAMTQDAALEPFRALQNQYIILDAALDWSAVGLGVIDAERHYLFLSSLFQSAAWSGVVRYSSDHQQYISGHRGAKLRVLKYKVGELGGKRALYLFGMFEKLIFARPIAGQDYFVSDEMGFNFATYTVKGEDYVLPTGSDGKVTPQVSSVATGMVLRLVLNEDGSLNGPELMLDYYLNGADGIPGLGADAASFAFDQFHSLGAAGIIKNKMHTTVTPQIPGHVARELLGYPPA